MAVDYKRVLRKNPLDDKAAPMFYPQLVTGRKKSVGIHYIAEQIQKGSGLSLGTVKSVLTDFVGAMKTAVYAGHAVNIPDFGIFTLGARTEGVEDITKCNAERIKSVRLKFRSSANVRPTLATASTRAGDRISFNCIDPELKTQSADKDKGSAGKQPEQPTPAQPDDNDSLGI